MVHDAADVEAHYLYITVHCTLGNLFLVYTLPFTLYSYSYTLESVKMNIVKSKLGGFNCMCTCLTVILS